MDSAGMSKLAVLLGLPGISEEENITAFYRRPPGRWRGGNRAVIESLGPAREGPSEVCLPSL